MDMNNTKLSDIIARINSAILLSREERIGLAEELRPVLNEINVIDNSNNWHFATDMKYNLREKLGVVIRGTMITQSDLHIPAWLRAEISSIKRGQEPSKTFIDYISKNSSPVEL